MSSRSLPLAGALVATASLALPASAAAAEIDTAVKAVRAHTVRADAALDRAVTLFRRGQADPGQRSFGVSRRDMSKAKAAAARARRLVEGEADWAKAARAQELVARQQDENVERLTAALEPAEGGVESKIAQAALADTVGRDKALAVLSELLERGVPEQAKAGLLRAISALSQKRDDEVRASAEALQSQDVSAGSKRTLAKAVDENVDGQKTAAAKLIALIESENVPAAAKVGLRRAYDAVTREQGRAAEALDKASAKMPAGVRRSLGRVVDEARDNARDLRGNRPPSAGERPGQAPGQPGGTPGTTPGGPPSGRG